MGSLEQIAIRSGKRLEVATCAETATKPSARLILTSRLTLVVGRFIPTQAKTIRNAAKKARPNAPLHSTVRMHRKRIASRAVRTMVDVSQCQGSSRGRLGALGAVSACGYMLRTLKPTQSDG